MQYHLSAGCQAITISYLRIKENWQELKHWQLSQFTSNFSEIIPERREEIR